MADGYSYRPSPNRLGGRVADLMKDMNTNQKVSISLSMNGTNLFQQGLETIPYSLNTGGAEIIWAYNRGNEWDSRSQAIDSLMYHNYQDAFKQTYIDEIRRSQEGGEVFAMRTIGGNIFQPVLIMMSFLIV